jgi:hypothetical protein
MAMYLSNVSAERVKQDCMGGNIGDFNAKLAATQFVIPLIPLARKKVNNGMLTIPTAKSLMDCTRMMK